MQTIFYNKINIPQKEWHLFDAQNEVLGRLSTKIAMILQGKTKSFYTPNADLGDFVIVVNAKKIVLTGNKKVKKLYWRHTGYPGGIKKTTFLEMQTKAPERIIFSAVRRMLPKSKLGRQMLKKLKVYSGPIHPHQAQLKK